MLKKKKNGQRQDKVPPDKEQPSPQQCSWVAPCGPSRKPLMTLTDEVTTISEPNGKKKDCSSFPARTQPMKRHGLCLLQPSQLPFVLCKRVLLPVPLGACTWLHGGRPWTAILCWSQINPFCWRNIWQSVCFRSTKGRELTRSGDPGRLRKANYPRDTAEWTLVDTSQADQMQDYKDPKDQE